MELGEQSGIDTWRGAAEGGTFLLWRSSMPAAGGGAYKERWCFSEVFFFLELSLEREALFRLL